MKARTSPVMLLEYLQAALNRARYEPHPPGMWHGYVPGFPGVYAFANTREECRKKLHEALDEFVLFRSSRGLDLPPVDGVALPGRVPAVPLDLEARIKQLEGEVSSLAELARLSADRRWISPRVRRLAGRFRLDRLGKGLEFDRAYKFGLANWGVVLSALGLAAVLYAYVWYGVSYFENFQNTSTTKLSAEFYRELGDRMLGRRDFKAAEEFYEAALKVNPNNIEATRGVLISQVFKLPEGKKFLDPGLTHLKLQTLKSKFGREDFRLTFCNGLLQFQKNNFEEAEKLFNESIRQSSDAGTPFAANYDMIGHINMDRRHALAAGCESFRKAVEIEDDNFSTRLNLGYCYFRQQDFAKAAEHMEASFALSPRLAAAIHLGNNYLLAWNKEEARRKYDHARFVVGIPGVEKEFYISERTIYHFMPEPGDAEIYKRSVSVAGLAQNVIFLDYASALDYAVGGQIQLSDERLRAALAADEGRLYREFFVNYVNYLLRTANPQRADEKVLAQLAALKRQMQPPAAADAGQPPAGSAPGATPAPAAQTPAGGGAGGPT